MKIYMNSISVIKNNMLKIFSKPFIVLFTILVLSQSLANQAILDQYPQSLLYSEPVEVVPNVWSAIGQTAPGTYENSGHNNNLSFIVTCEGVVVVNGGAAFKLAEALHQEIKAITDQPVVLVINENAQGHAMLGNSYWAAQEVPILAHESAVEEWDVHAAESLLRMKKYNKEKAENTTIVDPTDTFKDKKLIELGGITIEVLWLGLAHSPGDVIVHLPKQKLVIAGDMAFHERLLPIMTDTQTADWLDSWERFEALDALYVIPGHGHPSNMAQVRRYTKDYLVFLRNAIQEILDDGGDLQSAYELDQSEFAHLDTFEELAAQNAGRVFEQMEFE